MGGVEEGISEVEEKGGLFNDLDPGEGLAIKVYVCVREKKA